MFIEKISNGKIDCPIFITIYGPDGCGKSTFASDAPSPIFICSETGTNHLDVSRLPRPKTFQELMAMVDELSTQVHPYETLVIDSLDWAEPLIWQEVVTEAGVKFIGDIGYGKGYDAALNKWQNLINKLKALREKMNVILIAHSVVKTFQDPIQNMGYDRYELKLHAKAAGLIREAVDAVLFATYEVFTKKDGQKTRAFGDGARVMFTERRPGHDAKNRFGLPYQLDLSWDEFFKAVKSGEPDAPESIKKDINQMLSQIKDEALKKLVTETAEKAGNDAKQLAKIQNRLRIKLDS